MQKVALILHGWPQTSMNQHILGKFFKKNKYILLTPNLFDEDWGKDLKDIVENINTKLGVKNLDVIVGISMGGLVLPSLAEKHPRAKLIFISTAPYFKPDLFIMRVLANLTILSFIQKLFVLIAKISGKSFIEFVYRKLNPFDGNQKHRKAYEEDLKRNLKEISRYPFSKHVQMLALCSKIDNTKILRTLKNKCIIFGGRGDKLMPYALVKELSKLLPNSKLIITSGLHFNSFEKKNLRDLKVYLK